MAWFRRRRMTLPSFPEIEETEEWVHVLSDAVPTPVPAMPPPHPPTPPVSLRREELVVKPAEAKVAAPTSVTIELTPRVERALLALAAHAHQIEDRMRRLEDRIEHAEHAPTHEDVMDVRMHSARVAGELARVTVQLQAEIDSAKQRPTAEAQRVDALAEQVLALWDQIEALPVAVPPDDPAAEFARRRNDEGGTGPGLVAIA